MMHATGGAQIRIVGSMTPDELGELAKVARRLGFGLEVPVDNEDYLAFLRHPGADFTLPTLAAYLVALSAQTEDESIESVLKQLSIIIDKRLHFGPQDKKPSDNRPHGSGHVEGQ